MILSMLVAMTRNRVIGVGGGLPWHLPADLKRFKELTLGKAIIMGRRTYESIGHPLPGRQNIVITRQKDYAPEGVTLAHSMEEALARTEEGRDVAIIGGAEIYHMGLPLTHKLFITEVLENEEQPEITGDVRFPDFNRGEWQEVAREDFPADEKHAHAFSFITLERLSPITEED